MSVLGLLGRFTGSWGYSSRMGSTGFFSLSAPLLIPYVRFHQNSPGLPCLCSPVIRKPFHNEVPCAFACDPVRPFPCLRRVFLVAFPLITARSISFLCFGFFCHGVGGCLFWAFCFCVFFFGGMLHLARLSSFLFNAFSFLLAQLFIVPVWRQFTPSMLYDLSSARAWPKMFLPLRHLLLWEIWM